MQTWQDSCPYVDNYDMIMQEVAFNAKCGGELHFSEYKFQPSSVFSMASASTISSTIDMGKGSVDPRVLALVGNEPKGVTRAFSPVSYTHLTLPTTPYV